MMTRQTAIKEAARIKHHTQEANFSRLKLVYDSFNFPYQDHLDKLSKCSYDVTHHLSHAGKAARTFILRETFLAVKRPSIGREVYFSTNRKESDS